MKTLGIIGGMSPASTITYYREINRLINQEKGGNHSAPILLYSVNFEEIVQCQKQNQWQKAAELLTRAAQQLQQMGTDGILIAANTMHKVAPEVIAAINVPFLHIVNATAQAIQTKNLSRVALLGTAFVMQEDFYRNGLAEQGIEVLVPDLSAQAEIHRIIFEELCLGDIRPQSKAFYLKVINELAQQGAEGVVLGCTEIGLLLQQNDCHLPFFDTAQLHSEMAAKFVLKDEYH